MDKIILSFLSLKNNGTEREDDMYYLSYFTNLQLRNSYFYIQKFCYL